MASGVYSITHAPSERAYVGSSANIDKRCGEHRRMLRKGTHYSKYLQNTWAKHPESDFVFDVIEECDPDIRIEREQHYLDTMEPVFNSCKVAGVTTGYKYTPEARAKISAALMGKPGRPHTDETKAKIGAGNKGKQISPETRAKLSAANKGKVNSPEARAKLSAVGLGRKHSPQHSAAITASLMGHKLSPESRYKISAARTGKKLSPEHRAAISAGLARHYALKAEQALQLPHTNEST